MFEMVSILVLSRPEALKDYFSGVTSSLISYSYPGTFIELFLLPYRDGEAFSFVGKYTDPAASEPLLAREVAPMSISSG